MPGAYATQTIVLASDFPDRAELPAQRAAEHLEHSRVDLDRAVHFGEDPGDGMLDALEIARVGELSARPLNASHRYL